MNLAGQTPAVKDPALGVAPGVHFEVRSSPDVSVRGLPFGIPGFVGYAALKARTDQAESRWPVIIQSIEQAQAQLEVPEWGNLLPCLDGFFQNGGKRCLVAGLPWDRSHAADFVRGGSSVEARTGLQALELSKEVELLCLPDLFLVPTGCRSPSLEQVVGVHRALLTFCSGGGAMRSRGGYFALLDAPPGLSPLLVSRYVSRLRELQAAPFGALYYPWMDMVGRDGQVRRCPPCGAIAGMFARLCEAPPGRPPGTVSFGSGPHQTPANRPLTGAVGVEQVVPRKSFHALLNGGINGLIPWPGRGIVVWGARTLSSRKEDNHITVRRILSFVRRTVYETTQWAVFEPNSPLLWLELSSYITNFLEELWSAGLLVGATPGEAFFVQCDRETNPPEEIEAGRINIVLMVRPVRSTEFIMVRISHGNAMAG